MIVVRFETGSYAEIVAVFSSEELYMECLPALEKEAEDNGFERVTESVVERLTPEIKNFLEDGVEI